MNSAMCKIVGISSPNIVLKKNVTMILDPTEYARALGEYNNNLAQK